MSLDVSAVTYGSLAQKMSNKFLTKLNSFDPFDPKSKAEYDKFITSPSYATGRGLTKYLYYLADKSLNEDIKQWQVHGSNIKYGKQKLSLWG